MVTLLLSTLALAALIAVGAGTLLVVAASSKEIDACEEAKRCAAPPERTSFPDTLDRGGSLVARGAIDGPSRPPGPVDEEEDLILRPSPMERLDRPDDQADGADEHVAIEALCSHHATREPGGPRG